MTDDLLPVWPAGRIEQALGLLTGRRIDLTFPSIAEGVESQRDLEPWIYAACAARHLEAEPLRLLNGDLEQAVRGASPALLVVLEGALAVKSASGNRVVLYTLEGNERVVSVDQVCAAMRELWERRYGLTPVEYLLDAARVPLSRRPKARAALMRQQLASRSIDAGWTVRLAPSAPLPTQLYHSRQIGSVVKMVLASTAGYGATLAAWYMLGQSALGGSLDSGWDIAWILALLTGSVLQVLAGFWQGTVSIGLGALFKRRLLLGALRLDATTSRRDGVGSLLSRVLDSDAVEELSLTGGFTALLALVEMGVAMLVIVSVSTLATAVVLVAGGVAVTALVSVESYRRAQQWTSERLTMSQDLVERLVGHRTRMAQEHPSHWHVQEDHDLAQYAQTSRRMDRFFSAAGIMPRSLLIIGILLLTPAFVAGTDSSKLTVSVGALVLLLRALTRLSSSSGSLMEAAIAWRNAAPLFRAAGHAEEVASASGLAASTRVIMPGESILDAHALAYGYRANRQVLTGLDLRVGAGDNILLEGDSGSGKSTLVSILVGLRRATSGVLLLGGLDRETLGAAVWRRRIAAAPQFHDNHILHGTLAFNLLMAREWPPREADLAEAEQVCRELGLGPLLDRMPNGLSQMVGDSGWRLSHGEQSRLFIARALLQDSDLLVLDESFAALDPDTLTLAMACVRRRARSLIVVAHP